MLQLLTARMRRLITSVWRHKPQLEKSKFSQCDRSHASFPFWKHSIFNAQVSLETYLKAKLHMVFDGLAVLSTISKTTLNYKFFGVGGA